MPFAWALVKARLEACGGVGDLRQNAAKDGLAITSHGSLVLDMTFDARISCTELEVLLNATPGIVEHGIFSGLAHQILLADNGVVQEITV
jgi:ribose 5-phosphate isomerase A